MWMFIVIACGEVEPDRAQPLSGPEASVADSGGAAPSDSGDLPQDTGGLDLSWPELERTAVWVSEHAGYGTGGAFADMDADGDVDLVVAHGNDMEPGRLTVFDNREGELEAEASWVSRDPAYYGHLDVGDVNNDGYIDVVVSRFLGAGRFEEPGGIEVFINRGGVLEETPSWVVSGFFSFSLALGDMDRDGSLDLAVAVGESYENEPDFSRIFLGDGEGGFGEAAVWFTDAPGYSFDVDWADFDGDGWLDVAFANQQDGHTIYQNREGIMSALPIWKAADADGPYEGNTLAIGDVDGDGTLDLAVSDNDQLGGVGEVRLWCGPDWELCHTVPQPYASAVALLDWDGDEDLDLVYGGWWSAVSILENRGGRLGSSPVWQSTKTDIVVEALDWAEVDGWPGPELMVTDWTKNSGNRLWARGDP